MRRALRALLSLIDVRVYLHGLRLLHYYGYTHVHEVGGIKRGPGVRLAPNVSICNGHRIAIGARSNIGARCALWAGDSHARILIGDDALFAPEVFITASDYGTQAGTPVMQQPKHERDVIIGNDVWLGARVIVVAGVEIGDGCVVGAGAVVTRSLPPGTIAAGVPARPVGQRAQPGPVPLELSS